MKLFGPRYPEEIAKRIPPGQRLVKTWPVLHFGPIPDFDESTWNLEVNGLVDKPYSLTYAELKELGPVDVQADMHCVTGWSTLDNTWTGVPFPEVAKLVRPRPEARHVMAHSFGGYTANIPIDELMRDDVLIAHRHNGEPLAAEHGGPVRLVVPQLYFWKSAKWLRGFVFMMGEDPGFWEQYGYHIHGDPWKEERYA